MQSELLDEANSDPNEFWKTIGKVGISTKRLIPMEVVLGDGSFREILKLFLINGKLVLKLCIRQMQQILTTRIKHQTSHITLNPFLMT